MNRPFTVILAVAAASQFLSNSLTGAEYSISNGDVAALISAITSAAESPEADTILLALDGLYTLTEAIGTEDEASGLPILPGGLTIDGRGATLMRSTAEGIPDFRILSAGGSDGDVTLKNLVIVNGKAVAGDGGGGVLNDLGDGIMTISNCTFRDNSSAEEGGAIYHVSGEDLIISDSTFENNSAVLRGGAILTRDFLRISDSQFTGNSTEGEGGCVYNGDECFITNSDFSGNVSETVGGAIFNDDELTITGGTFVDNTAPEGGAIYNYGELTWRNSIARNNVSTHANRGGGALYQSGQEAQIENVLFEENSANHGGAIDLDDAETTLTNCVFRNNTAVTYGGAIRNRDELIAFDCTFSGNTTTGDFAAGGAIFARSYDSGTVITQIFGGIISENTGGAIQSLGDLLAIDVLFQDNSSAGGGGGITNSGGFADVQNCRFIGNTATVSTGQTGVGGAIWNIGQNAQLRIDQCYFLANSAERSGGAVLSQGGNVILQHSAFIQNTVDFTAEISSGGGALYLSSTTFSATNCTFSENEAAPYGGAIGFGFGNDPAVNSCTFIGNASTGTGTNSGGGALYIGAGAVSVGNSLFADNTSATGGPDIRGSIDSRGYNLISDITDANISGVTDGNITGQDPQLMAFVDTGDYRSVYRPMPDSRVLDAGRSDTGDQAVFDDQFGFSRPRDFPDIADATGSDGTDIGAVELFPEDTAQSGAAWVVNTLDGGFDGVCGTDHCSLADAMLAAESSEDSKDVIFDESTFPAGSSPTAIILNGPLPGINGAVRILGPGADQVALRRNDAPGTPDFRIFRINRLGTAFIEGISVENGEGTDPDYGDLPIGGGLLNEGTLVMRDCVIRKCRANQGGGIYSSGDLILQRTRFVENTAFTVRLNGRGGGLHTVTGGNTQVIDCDFLDNTAVELESRPAFGGAISATGYISIQGTLFEGNSAFTGGALDIRAADIDGCLFVGNNAEGSGGAVSGSRSVHIVNSTFTGNTAVQGDAGALSVFSGSVRHCTISGNSAGRNGGGIRLSSSADLDMDHTIVANNIAGAAGPDVYGPLRSNGYNLIETVTDAEISGYTATNLTGVDPLLGSLSDNGGRILSLATMNGSPARNAGSPASMEFPASDQRGSLRVVDGRMDIGAYEHGDFIPQETYDDWVGRYNLSGQAALPAEDADKDGVANATEFSIGTDPTDPRSVPGTRMTPGIQKGVATVEIQKAPRVTGLINWVEWSPDAELWSTRGLEYIEVSPGRLNVQASSTVPNAYLRMVTIVD